MKIVRLSNVGHFAEAPATEKDGHYEKEVVLVHEGEFNSMDGPVVIDSPIIDLFAANHNALLSKCKRLATGDIPMKSYPPIQLDHSASATMTVGRLIGDLRAEDVEIEDGKKVRALMGKMRIMGAENIEKVKDGRWTHVSIGADLTDGKINELSITPFPADPNAAMLAAKNPKGESMKLTERLKKMFKLSEDKEADEKKEKLKKHLMDEEKMSSEDADEKLSKLSDEEMSKLSQDADDAEKKKLAAADEEGKEEEKKAAMAASRASAIKLGKGLVTLNKEVHLAARKAKIGARLSSLRKDKKITPAEMKKIDLASLAAMSDEQSTSVLKTYADREPVLDTEVHGSAHAINLQAIAKKYRLARMELEARESMPSKAKEAKAKLAALAEDEKKEIDAAKADGGSEASEDDYSPSYASLAAMIDSGDKEGAKVALKKFTDGSVPAEAVMVDEKQMSELDEKINLMQNQMKELLQLVGSLTGVDAKEFE